MFVAGEASGDAHAAKLAKALRDLSPQINFEFFGASGQKMREAGIEAVVDSDDFGIIGLPEIAKALPMFWNAFQKLKKIAFERKPDAVILVDFPEFNLKLAKSLSKKGIKVVYYISPQLWAWRKYRVKTIRKYVDLLLTILPFEKDWYAAQNIEHVEFVGNPLVNEVFSKLTKSEFCQKHDLDEKFPIVALLGGSRRKEVAKILPVLFETAVKMSESNKEIQFVVPIASNRKFEEIEEIKQVFIEKGIKLPEKLLVVQGETYEALNSADVAAVTSGTATLETAIIGTPLAVVYKSSAINYKILRPLISVEHFGLVNLIAQERLAKELIQDDFTPDTLAEELFRLLQSEPNQQFRKRLNEVSETLGQGGASIKAAQFILTMLQIKP